MERHVLRKVEKRDLPELVKLCQAHASHEASQYDPLYKVQDLTAHLFDQTPSFQCLVVERQGRLIGYAAYMKQFSTWEASFYVYMDCLYLIDAARSQGIGRELIEVIKEFARKEKCDHIQWQTPKSNESAIRFYHTLGAESKGKERFFLPLR